MFDLAARFTIPCLGHLLGVKLPFVVSRPHVEAMPPVVPGRCISLRALFPEATADASVMSLSQLLRHGHDAMSWKIEDALFWERFFKRLSELNHQALGNSFVIFFILYLSLFPKQELLGFSIHTTTGRWTR